MRRPIIAGNWKMNETVDQSLDLVTKLKSEVAKINDVDIVVCPPFTCLLMWAAGMSLLVTQRGGISSVKQTNQ